MPYCPYSKRFFGGLNFKVQLQVHVGAGLTDQLAALLTLFVEVLVQLAAELVQPAVELALFVVVLALLAWEPNCLALDTNATIVAMHPGTLPAIVLSPVPNPVSIAYLLIIPLLDSGCLLADMPVSRRYYSG